MKCITLAALSILLIACFGNEHSSEGEPQPIVSNKALPSNTGLRIETGVNRGITPNDSLGIHSFLINTETTITNDSTIPIHVYLELSQEYDPPQVCQDARYRVMLLPNDFYDANVIRFNDFVENQLANPYVLDQTLSPGDSCVITMGTLYDLPCSCGLVPRAVFAFGDMALYESCSRQSNPAISTDPELEICIQVEHYYERSFAGPGDGCVVIPCGRISYLKE